MTRWVVAPLVLFIFAGCRLDVELFPGRSDAGASCQRFEAELATVVAPMQTRADALASNGTYVSTDTLEQGELSIAFNAPSSGTYAFVARVRTTPDTTYCQPEIAACNSFYAGIDNEPALHNENDVYATELTNTWTWDTINRYGPCDAGCFVDPWHWQLDAGAHVLHLYGREPYTDVDVVSVWRCPINDCSSVIDRPCD